MSTGWTFRTVTPDQGKAILATREVEAVLSEAPSAASFEIDMSLGAINALFWPDMDARTGDSLLLVPPVQGRDGQDLRVYPPDQVDRLCETLTEARLRDTLDTPDLPIKIASLVEDEGIPYPGKDGDPPDRIRESFVGKASRLISYLHGVRASGKTLFLEGPSW